jgi:hypothetical protein
VLLCQLINEGRNHPALAAPGCHEVNNNGAVALDQRFKVAPIVDGREFGAKLLFCCCLLQDSCTTMLLHKTFDMFTNTAKPGLSSSTS